MRQIIVTEILGATYPITVYLSDVYGNNLILLGTIISPIPSVVTYTIQNDSIFNTAPKVLLTMVDSNNIEYMEFLECAVEIPTPTITPTPTKTPGLPQPSPTPTKTPGLPQPSPTPTIIPSSTQTNTPTPTITPSSTHVPIFMAYIFAEPQVSDLDLELFSYANTQGSDSWYSWFGNGVPNNNSGNYSNDLNIYAHQPNFILGENLYIKPTILSSQIAQYQGQIINGLSQNIYTFGDISINLSGDQKNTLYFYSIWLPLNGVGGVMSAITIDVGTSFGGSEVYDSLPALSQTILYDVSVTTGAAIPEGTYRVIWITPLMQLPATLPLISILHIRGDTKF